MKKAFKGSRTTLAASTNVSPTLADLTVKISNYDSLTPYQRQKALAAYSVERTLKRLTTNSRSKAIRDNKEFSITYQDLMDLWNSQKGLCYYSKQPMTVMTITKAM